MGRGEKSPSTGKLDEVPDQLTRKPASGSDLPLRENKIKPLLRDSFDHLIEHHTRLFAGREEIIKDIIEYIARERAGYIFIEGPSGYGKTSLLAALVHDNPRFSYHFISQAYKTKDSETDPTDPNCLLNSLNEQMQRGDHDVNGRLSARARFHALLRTSPHDSQRVVVIDGIDEVDRHPNYLHSLLPSTLAPGVYLILSARSVGDRDYLREVGLSRRDIGKLIQMPGLGKKAIAAVLRAAGITAETLAHDVCFVDELYRVSQGDPFYLRFLIEDIEAGLITRDTVASTPSGLGPYLDMQLALLDRSAHSPQHRDILGIILAAYGPVSRRDLIAVVPGLDGLNFDGAIKDIHRFLIMHNDSYTFCHQRFKEYFMSKVHGV